MTTIRNTCLALQEFCEQQFRLIESAVPPPQWVPWGNAYNWRYTEQTPTQMLVQKLARQITGLKALDVLLAEGLLQEAGIMFRVLDEISEDVLFVTTALVNNAWTENHTKYAAYFWCEDESDQQPPLRRKTIRAFANRVFNQQDPSSADAVGRNLHRAFSDFIHARSAPTMGMVSGPPAKFHLDGITDTSARSQYIEQAPCYYYRAAVSVAVVAKVVLSDELNAACYAELSDFERQHAALLFPVSHQNGFSV